MVFILVANLIYCQAPDAEYKYVTSATDGTKYFVYMEKAGGDGIKYFWMKTEIPLKDLKGKKLKEGGTTILRLIRMKCSNRLWDNLEMIKYDKKGRVSTTNKNVSFDNGIIPGSVMTGVYDFVCGNQ